MPKLSSLIHENQLLNLVYRPIIFRLGHSEDKVEFDRLLQSHEIFFAADEILGQLQELIKSLHPAIKIPMEEYPGLIDKHLQGTDPDKYGVWVYYPWSKKVVHTLDEVEFIEVRTNRNRYKITSEEQHQLSLKKIGIVGLSVGQSIALTMAIERTCGELRLADFDAAELSNLNRIRTGIQNLGLNKTIIAAREIAEIDPFLEVKIFNDGLHTGNMDDFFLRDGKLDLFVEVCDGLDIKIESRYKAREYQIPVIMDTNDRGMLDVERFDLEPNRPVLHGLADGLDPESIKDLSNEDKIPYILRMIGSETISTRLKASMLEVQQSINTWPQLASSVTLGGALTTDVSRRILLDQYHDSGRYYIDLEELVKDKARLMSTIVKPEAETNPYTPLTNAEQTRMVAAYYTFAELPEFKLPDDELDQIIDAAIAAPSAGNNQPWKWVFSKGMLFLFHDRHRSWSWGDYKAMGANMALGAALENVHLQAHKLGLKAEAELLPLVTEPALVAALRFYPSSILKDNVGLELSKQIFTRRTNRKVELREPLPTNFLNQLMDITGRPIGLKLFIAESENDLAKLAEIIAECDKVRLLNELGHEEFYHELRWDRKHAEETRDGVELSSVDITQSEIAGFKVAGDWRAVSLIAEWEKGNAFKKLSLQAVKTASAMILFTVDGFAVHDLINAGRAIQRVWLFAAQIGVSIHPMLSPAFFFSRLEDGKGEGLSSGDVKKLAALRKDFKQVFPLDKDKDTYKEVFLMKVSLAGQLGLQSLRKNKGELFYKEHLS